MSPRARLFAGLAAAVVVTTVVVAFITIGPPWEIRRERLDAQRTSDLQRLSAAIERYHHTHGRLPTELSELEAEPRYFVDIRDPVSGEMYEYIPGENEKAYRLCARFETESEADAPGPTREGSTFWRHQPGRTCYTFEVTQRK